MFLYIPQTFVIEVIWTLENDIGAEDGRGPEVMPTNYVYINYHSHSEETL